MTSSTARPRSAGWTAAGWAGLAVGAAVLASAWGGALSEVFGPEVMGPEVMGTVVARAGMDAAGVACVGLTLLGVLLPLGDALPGRAVRDVARLQVNADRALVVLAGAWFTLVLVGIALRAADAVGRPVSALGAGEVVRWSTQLGAGRGMLLALGCTAVVFGCAVSRVRDPDLVPVRVPLIAALLGVLAPAITGHAGSAPDHQLTVVTVAVHAGAAALWVGGLGAVLVLVTPHRALLGEVVPRFSRLAGGCVVAVGLTGLLNAQLRLGSWEALVGTAYGGLVVAKAVLLVLIAVLGGVARRRLAAGRTPVLRWAGLEVALMAAALGLAAALTQTA